MMPPLAQTRATGFEPVTFGSGGRRSIQLSYARSVREFGRKAIRCRNGGQRDRRGDEQGIGGGPAQGEMTFDR